eukprot:3840807-Rhodomonas_salina.2
MAALYRRWNEEVCMAAAAAVNVTQCNSLATSAQACNSNISTPTSSSSTVTRYLRLDTRQPHLVLGYKPLTFSSKNLCSGKLTP